MYVYSVKKCETSNMSLPTSDSVWSFHMCVYDVSIVLSIDAYFWPLTPDGESVKADWQLEGGDYMR